MPHLTRRTLLATPLALAPTLAAPAAGGSGPATVVYVAAHQDDETLSMGSSIAEHVDAGHDVLVVAATDGSATGSGRRSVEKRLGPVTDAQLVTARDVEFLHAVTTLGATPVLPPPGVRVRDGHLDDDAATRMLTWVLASWPGARVKTHSPLAPHSDHAALGRATTCLYRQGAIGDLRLYLSAGERARVVGGPRLSRVRHPRVVDAAAEYLLWQPSAGRWSVGGWSARALLSALSRDPSCYRYAPTLED